MVLWQPIGWAAVFMAINGYHVWRLWRERRPVELSADEARLYDLTFFPLTRLREPTAAAGTAHNLE